MRNAEYGGEQPLMRRARRFRRSPSPRPASVHWRLRSSHSSSPVCTPTESDPPAPRHFMRSSCSLPPDFHSAFYNMRFWPWAIPITNTSASAERISIASSVSSAPSFYSNELIAPWILKMHAHCWLDGVLIVLLGLAKVLENQKMSGSFATSPLPSWAVADPQAFRAGANAN